MYDLTAFTLKDMTTCGSELRSMGAGAGCMEEVAQEIVSFFYENLVDHNGKRASSLVRFFITHPYQKLDEELKSHVQKVLGHPPNHPAVNCQTLLATAGDKAEWNDRHQSQYYKVLPLNKEILEDNPMFTQVAETFGIIMEKIAVLDPEFLVDIEMTTYNVFHVSDAVGNFYVPDQKSFVIPYGIKSVLGFYGMLPSGSLFTVIIFFKSNIPKETTEYFKTLLLNVKLAILPFDERTIFLTDTPVEENETYNKNKFYRSQTAGLTQLINVQEQVVLEQSERLEQVLRNQRFQTQELEQQIKENVRLREQAERAAVLQERNRLARDLHDSVTQALYSQTLYAEAAARQLEAGVHTSAADHLRQLGLNAQQALREMRLLIFELRPSILESEGFIAALRTRLEAVECRTGIDTKMEIDESIQLPANIETNLYWIVQEALNNILKYAQANRVVISLNKKGQKIILQIKDNGIGFNINDSSKKGRLGLKSMQERAASLNSKLSIQSEPGSGTLVQLEIPNEE